MTAEAQPETIHGAVKLVLAGRYDASGPEAARPLTWLRAFKRAVEAESPELLFGAKLGRDAGTGHPTLRLRLHPAASDVVVAAPGDGRVVVVAETAAVGPGYHRHLCGLMDRLSETLEIDWATDGMGSVDTTGYFFHREGAALEHAMLTWLRHAAQRALAARSRSDRPVSLCLRQGHVFDLPGAAVLTPLGPRDDGWLMRVAVDPRSGIDLFPWWEEGFGARARLGLALSIMWTQLVWRPPLLDEEWERLRTVSGLLKKAYREQPELAYPWAEWKELLGYLGQGGTLADELRERTRGLGESAPVGYRRRDVQVRLPEGWVVPIDGRFAESRQPDGSWAARDHHRSIRLTPLEASHLEGQASAPLELLGAPLEHRSDTVTSHGALHTVSADDHRLTAVVEAPSARALCVITFQDEEDRRWAEQTWRSVAFSAAA